MPRNWSRVQATEFAAAAARSIGQEDWRFWWECFAQGGPAAEAHEPGGAGGTGWAGGAVLAGRPFTESACAHGLRQT